MMITVRYLMAFSQITGTKSEQIELMEGNDITQLLEKLIIRHGRKFKKALEKEFDHRSVLYMVNEKTVEVSQKLNDGDEVLISYPVGGG